MGKIGFKGREKKKKKTGGVERDSQGREKKKKDRVVGETK